MFRMILHYLEACFSLLVPCLVSHVWKTTIAVPGLSTLPSDPPVTVTGDYAVEVEVAVNAGATNVEVDIGTIDKTKIQSIVINADKAAMDVYTNDAAGSTGQHFALAANKSIAWNINLLPNQTNPISANITKFFGNNASIVNGTLRVGILMNS